MSVFIMPESEPDYTGLSTRKIAGLYRNTAFCPSKNGIAGAQPPSLFEEVVLAIEASGLLDVLVHPDSEKYPNQSILMVALDGYVYLVPYVKEADYFFLKTVIPSRKATPDCCQTALVARAAVA